MKTNVYKPIQVNPATAGRGFLLIALAGVLLALSPIVRAVDPPPGGVYPNQNTAVGQDALFSLDISQGDNNTAIGFDALYHNTTGYYNTATGAIALFSNTTGFYNTAMGISALYYNTTGEANTALGSFALVFNTIGSFNTATGDDALDQNTTGNDNTANGCFALASNTTGSNNTATGLAALFSDTTGNNNTATGVDALRNSTTGNYCTADGQGSLFSNTTGRNNTAHGQNAMRNNTTGSFNVALGDNAGFNLTTGSNNIEIGNRGFAGEANTTRIGKQGTQTATFIAGISGATVPTGVAVIVDANGHLGTITSSARFKEAIKPMDKTSEAILALKPVTFIYKQELDPAGTPQFGLVAEEVEKVNPNLVARDEQGKPYTVRYEAVNAMLLNEFLKEHRKGQEQDVMIAQLKSAVAQQQKEINVLIASLKEQGAQIQKVRSELALSRPAPRVAANDP